jgi:hypothetical protein
VRFLAGIEHVKQLIDEFLDRSPQIVHDGRDVAARNEGIRQIVVRVDDDRNGIDEQPAGFDLRSRPG